MFGIGAFELFAILVIAMIILGPDRLPRAMGTVGSWVRELRRLTREFRAEFDEEIKLLQGELDTIREEAELTRKELEEIRSDIETSMTEVQEDIQQAGEDMKEELSGAEQDIRGVGKDVPKAGRVPAANAPQRSLPARSPAALPQAPAPLPQAALPEAPTPAPAPRFPDPSDAMYAAILDTFSTGNGELTASPQPAASARGASDTGVLDIGDDWEQIQSAAGDGETSWEKPPANRPLAFSPQNDQFGAILKAVAEAGDEAAASARAALEYQASLDTQELAHLNGKGPAGLAFAWAAQRQAVMEDGAVEIDVADSDGARIRLHACPYGLTGPDGLAACELSNAYDRALAAGLGLDARYDSRITEGASFCDLVISKAVSPESGSEAMEVSAADGAKSGSSSNDAGTGPAEGDGESVKSSAVEAVASETG